MGVTRRPVEAPDGIGHYDEIKITDLDSTSLDNAQVDTLTSALDQLFGAWGFEPMVSGAEAYWRAQPDDGDRTPLSRGWYRSRILSEIAWVRKIVRGGIRPDRLEEAIVSAMRLGETITEAQWRFGFGKAIKTGKKVRASTKASAQKRGVRVREQARDLKAEVKTLADDFRRAHPHTPTIQMARAIHRKLQRPLPTIRRLLQELKKS
jgi:hypothetical protein